MFQNFKMFLYAKLGVNHLEGNLNPPNPLSHEEYRHSHTTFRSHVTVCRVYLSRVNEVAGSTSICGRATNSLDPWWEQSAWVHPVQPREWSPGRTRCRNQAYLKYCWKHSSIGLMYLTQILPCIYWLGMGSVKTDTASNLETVYLSTADLGRYFKSLLINLLYLCMSLPRTLETKRIVRQQCTSNHQTFPDRLTL